MIWFIIPIYNEADNIPGFIETIQGTIKDEKE